MPPGPRIHLFTCVSAKAPLLSRKQWFAEVHCGVHPHHPEPLRTWRISCMSQSSELRDLALQPDLGRKRCLPNVSSPLAEKSSVPSSSAVITRKTFKRRGKALYLLELAPTGTAVLEAAHVTARTGRQEAMASHRAAYKGENATRLCR